MRLKGIGIESIVQSDGLFQVLIRSKMQLLAWTSSSHDEKARVMKGRVSARFQYLGQEAWALL